MKREESTGSRADPCGLERSDFCDFDKPRKRAYQKGKIESNKQSKEGRPAEMSLWKRARCQTESKALEKSIVAKIVQDPGLGLLNPSEMD